MAMFRSFTIEKEADVELRQKLIAARLLISETKMRQLFLLVALFSSFAANAANFSFIGNLTDPNAVQLFNFSVSSPSNLVIRTWSYGGGTMANGADIDFGGFDPVLTLFSSAGEYLGERDDCSSSSHGNICNTRQKDPNTNRAYDAVLRGLEFDLDAGNYILALTQFENFAFGPDLIDGFTEGAVGFDDDDYNPTRTSRWALDINGVDSASLVGASPVPVPAAVWLFGSALMGLFGVKRKSA